MMVADGKLSASLRSQSTLVLLTLLLLWAGGVRTWFASQDLHAGRFWDERYGVKNTRAVVQGGSLRPVSFYYPSLSYLPHSAVLAVTQRLVRVADPGYSFFEGGRLRAEGYMICRSIQVIFGLLSILLTFTLARDLFGDHVALLAALLLAVSPQHIRLSAFYKPDIMLLFLTLLTLTWTLRALSRPSLSRYLLVGLGIGLTLSTKLNGGPVAVPIAVGALILGIRTRRHWVGLAAAGLTSLGVFVLLNPQVEPYLRALQRNRNIYASRGNAQDGVLLEALRMLLTPNFHGPLLGGLALAGLAFLAMKLVRNRTQEQWLSLGPTLLYPFVYVSFYAITTSYAKPNNFLQLLPFTSLAAAFLIFRCFEAVRGRLPALGSPRIGWATTALLATALIYPAQKWVYESLTPTTWQRAVGLTLAELRPWDGRVALFDESPFRLGRKSRAQRAAVREVAIGDLQSTALDRSDAEVFALRKLQGDGAAAYRSRLVPRSDREVIEVRKRLFRLRGEPVVIVLHPMASAGKEILELRPSEQRGGQVSFDLEPIEVDELVSIELWLPHRRGASRTAPEILLDDEALQVVARPFGRRTRWLSERTPRCAHSEQSLTISLPSEIPSPDPLTVTVYRWESPTSRPSVPDNGCLPAPGSSPK